MKEIRSKIIAVAAVAFMAVSFSACESVTPDSSTAPNTSTANTDNSSSEDSASTEAPVPEFDDSGSRISAVEVTDADGAAVTDADGSAVTELVILDEKGKTFTDTDGKNVQPVISASKAPAAVTTNGLAAIGKPDAMKEEGKIPQETSSDGPTVSIPDIEASAGETVSFKIDVTDNKGFIALNAYLEANSEYFEFVKASCTGGDAEDPENEDSLPYSNITISEYKNPEYPDMNTLVLLYFEGSVETLSGDVTLATVTLKVKEGTPAGKYDIFFDTTGDATADSPKKPAMCNDYRDGKIVIRDVTFKNGSITVK